MALDYVARKAPTRDVPRLRGRICIDGAQRELHAEPHARRLGPRVHQRVELTHVLVRVRMQVRDAQVEHALRKEDQVVLRREELVELARVVDHRMRDEDLVALREGGAERRVVVAADLAVRKVELAQPLLGAHLVDEVQADDLGPDLVEHAHGLPEVGRPEGERIVLEQEKRVVVHRDERGVLRNEALPVQDMPVVVVEVLEAGVPFAARRAERERACRRDDGQPAEQLLTQRRQSPT